MIHPTKIYAENVRTLYGRRKITNKARGRYELIESNY
jgi:hypothetical protein